MTRDEKNRKIAEALEPMPLRPEEYVRTANRVAFSRLGFWAHEFGKREWTPVHNFYLSEEDNALVLEAMPHPELSKRNDGIWWCIADYYDPKSLQYKNTDRKTAICEAFLVMLE